VIDMLWGELKKRYPNLELYIHDNSLHVIRGEDQRDQVIEILFDGDIMRVWRCIPRYESEAETIQAADPVFIEKIFDVMKGKRPRPPWLTI